MVRPMTPAEQQRFRGYFPNLNVNQAVGTDDATSAYNCIAWTVGVTIRWIWPGSSLRISTRSIVASDLPARVTAASRRGVTRRRA